MRLHALLILCLLGTVAAAQELPRTVLRMATIAPNGTAWAREFRALSRDVAAATDGHLTVKWYFGGIAGDEVQMEQRIERGQLDGAASGGPLCMRLAPSLKAVLVPGILQTRAETDFVIGRLAATFESEFSHSGFVPLAIVDLGPSTLFTRAEVHSFDDLKQVNFWRWDVDIVGVPLARAMGLKVTALPLERSDRAYDEGRIDGFIGIPMAALAFQWATRAHYLLDLPVGFLPGCLIMSVRSFDRLSNFQRDALKGAAAKLAVRFNQVGLAQDSALLGGLFQKQGLHPLPASKQLRERFLTAARLARERIGSQLMPAGVIEKVLAILADYRSEHEEGIK